MHDACNLNTVTMHVGCAHPRELALGDVRVVCACILHVCVWSLWYAVVLLFVRGNCCSWHVYSAMSAYKALAAKRKPAVVGACMVGNSLSENLCVRANRTS